MSVINTGGDMTNVNAIELTPELQEAVAKIDNLPDDENKGLFKSVLDGVLGLIKGKTTKDETPDDKAEDKDEYDASDDDEDDDSDEGTDDESDDEDSDDEDSDEDSDDEEDGTPLPAKGATKKSLADDELDADSDEDVEDLLKSIGIDLDGEDEEILDATEIVKSNTAALERAADVVEKSLAALETANTRADNLEVLLKKSLRRERLVAEEIKTANARLDEIQKSVDSQVDSLNKSLNFIEGRSSEPSGTPINTGAVAGGDVLLKSNALVGGVAGTFTSEVPTRYGITQKQVVEGLATHVGNGNHIHKGTGITSEHINKALNLPIDKLDDSWFEIAARELQLPFNKGA